MRQGRHVDRFDLTKLKCCCCSFSFFCFFFSNCAATKFRLPSSDINSNGIEKLLCIFPRNRYHQICWEMSSRCRSTELVNSFSNSVNWNAVFSQTKATWRYCWNSSFITICLWIHNDRTIRFVTRIVVVMWRHSSADSSRIKTRTFISHPLVNKMSDSFFLLYFFF